MKTFVMGIIVFSMFAIIIQPAAADYEAGLGYYRQENYGAAFREFSGDPTPQSKFYLSIMYEKGDGVPQNRLEALAMLRLAAEKGLDVAQASLGLMYLDGMGVPANEKEGIMWLNKAASQGLPEALQALGVTNREAGTEMVAQR